MGVLFGVVSLLAVINAQDPVAVENQITRLLLNPGQLAILQGILATPDPFPGFEMNSRQALKVRLKQNRAMVAAINRIEAQMNPSPSPIPVENFFQSSLFFRPSKWAAHSTHPRNGFCPSPYSLVCVL